MKHLSAITLALSCACLCSCLAPSVIAFRSNTTIIDHRNRAEFEGKIEDRGSYNGGSPAVNADKQYSDMYKDNANGSFAAGKNTTADSGKPAEEKQVEPAKAN